MDKPLLLIAGHPVQPSLLWGAVAVFVVLCGVCLGLWAWRVGSQVSARALDQKLSETNRLQAELAGRLQTIGEVLTTRQSDLARLVSDRLDGVGTRMGLGLEASSRTTAEHLAKLGERLAVIDSAQARLTGLTEEVVGLKNILNNKQTRGAFGQGRMEAIVRDGLPKDAFAFQHTLTNRNRPDCIIRLPGDDRVMVIDAKFPLESFQLLKKAHDAPSREAAATRVRLDVGRHIHDMADRYFIPGETQDLAILFVPAESMYADLLEHFEDVIQKAHRKRIIVVSPSLLMMAIQVLQALVRDARVREQAHLIQVEVRLLLEDARRLRERAQKLEQHYRQGQDDVTHVLTSAGKIITRAEKIDQVDLAETPPDAHLTPQSAGTSKLEPTFQQAQLPLAAE